MDRVYPMCGRRRLGKNFLTCCSTGRVRSCVRPVCAAMKPLAIMLCADRVPILECPLMMPWMAFNEVSVLLLLRVMEF